MKLDYSSSRNTDTITTEGNNQVYAFLDKKIENKMPIFLVLWRNLT